MAAAKNTPPPGGPKDPLWQCPPTGPPHHQAWARDPWAGTKTTTAAPNQTKNTSYRGVLLLNDILVPETLVQGNKKEDK